jgi:hypothetical protein
MALRARLKTNGRPAPGPGLGGIRRPWSAFEARPLTLRELQDVVIKTILGIPGSCPRYDIVHGAANIDKVLKELAGDVFIGGFPAPTLGQWLACWRMTLVASDCDMAPVGRGLLVEDADVVRPEAALKDFRPSVSLRFTRR